MRPIAINLAACAVLLAACGAAAGDLNAEAVNGRDHSAWPEEQVSREKTPLAKWLPTVLPGLKNQAPPEAAAESEPAAAEPAAPPPPKKRRARRAPEPQPEPEPKLTAEEQEAEDRWWKETGDPAVAAFSRCLSEHVIDETSRGSKASYPEFVTSAMNSRCNGEFATMAQLILDRHGDDNFARIARKLIATKFVPVVKRVAEGGPPEELPPEAQRPVLEAEVRQSKEAMLACMSAEADRQAASSAAPVEKIADDVLVSCQTTADAFFAKLEQLNPGTIGSAARAQPAAILDTSYRPAIVQRITLVRGDPADTAGPPSETQMVGKGDAETAVHKRQAAASQHSQNTAYPPAALIPPAVIPPAVTPPAVVAPAVMPPAVTPEALTPEAVTPEALTIEAVPPPGGPEQAAPEMTDPDVEPEIDPDVEIDPDTDPAAISPTGEPAPGSPVPASSQP